MRLIDANALIAYCDKNWIPLNVDAVNAQPTIEPEKRTETNACDCISRHEVIYSFEFDDDGTPWNMSDIIYRLEQMPSAQPERKTGTWIPQDHNRRNGYVTTTVYYYPKCSECGHSGNYGMNYCPNCGARMEGDAE